MFVRAISMLLFILVGSAANAAERATRQETGGELLYTTYCVACHNTQVHWRSKRLAKDWPGLLDEVRRWQKSSGLSWGEGDVALVARYLNERYYHYPASY